MLWFRPFCSPTPSIEMGMFSLCRHILGACDLFWILQGPTDEHVHGGSEDNLDLNNVATVEILGRRERD